MAKLNMICLQCFSDIEPPFNVFRVSFLGFKKCVCPHCKKEFLADLRTANRVFYIIWLALGAFVLPATFEGLATGNVICIPGLFPMLMAWALVTDHRKRKEIKLAREKATSEVKA